MNEIITKLIAEHAEVISTMYECTEMVSDIVSVVVKSLQKGGTIFWCGNGGSAADSQHLAAELMGRFRRERKALRSIALTTDTSVLTAIGNDYGYENVFTRQVEGMIRAGDVLVGISTSGNSANVLQALHMAKVLGAETVALLGHGGGSIKNEVDLSIVVPSTDTARIQEVHIMIGHIICDLVEREFV